MKKYVVVLTEKFWFEKYFNDFKNNSSDMFLTLFPLFTGQFIQMTNETEGESRRSQERRE